jgi:hypothetical protein
MAKAEKTYERGLEQIQDMLGWTKITDNESVICYRKPNPDTDFDSLKVEMFVEKSPQVSCEYVHSNW